MIDYNLNIESFSNKKFQCLCGGSYIRNNLSSHAITKICINYRIKNNLPILEKKQIICEICNVPYKKSQKRKHESSERHQEYLKHQGKDNFEDLINEFEKMKIEERKEYRKNYNNSKIFYCEICNKEMKISSRRYHLYESEEH